MEYENKELEAGTENRNVKPESQGYGETEQSCEAADQPACARQSSGQSEQPGGQGYSRPNYGIAPVEANGRTLDNRFGMKLTFSILEILSCCGCNPITVIMGILGCVFSVQANSAYKDGRWDEFESKAKKATIFLWIGFGVLIFNIILVIISWKRGMDSMDNWWLLDIVNKMNEL